MWFRAWLFTLLWMALVTRLSHLPVGLPPTEAVLRLSWKTMGEKVRIPVAEDPNLPAHMRAPGGAFRTELLPYRLVVKIDERTRLDRVVRPPGVHHDRPLSVLEELRLPPGPQDVLVWFRPDSDSAPLESPRYELASRIELSPGRVTLITLESLKRAEAPAPGSR